MCKLRTLRPPLPYLCLATAGASNVTFVVARHAFPFCRVQWLCNVSGPGEVASTVLRHCVLVALAPPQLDTIGANGEPVYAAADLDALAQDMGTVRPLFSPLSRFNFLNFLAVTFWPSPAPAHSPVTLVASL